MESVKVGGIEFNISAIKAMSLKDFTNIYNGSLKQISAKDAYYKITGKKKPTKRK